MDAIKPPAKIPKEEPTQKDNQYTNEGGELISWQALEYDYFSKSQEWYWSLGILTVALVIMAFLMGNFLFAVFIAVAGFTLALYGAKKPKKVKFILSTKGVRIADRLYPYDSLRSFWIHYDPPRKKTLDIISKKTFMPKILIPLEDTDPNKIREILIRVLKEEEAEESLSEIIAGRLGF